MTTDHPDPSSPTFEAELLLAKAAQLRDMAQRLCDYSDPHIFTPDEIQWIHRFGSQLLELLDDGRVNDVQAALRRLGQ